MCVYITENCSQKITYFKDEKIGLSQRVVFYIKIRGFGYYPKPASGISQVCKPLASRNKISFFAPFSMLPIHASCLSLRSVFRRGARVVEWT